LGLGEQEPSASKEAKGSSPEDWVVKGVRFAAGTEFRANYKGRTHTARVEGGALALNGQRYDSPSPAAMAITKSAVNGWRFWECRTPGSSSWRLMKTFRE
jgi:hypothetical protein